MKFWFTLFFFALSVFGARPTRASDSDAVTPTGLGISVGAWINPNFSGVVKSGPNGTEASLNSNLGIRGQTMIVPHAWYRWSHGQIFDIRYQEMTRNVTTILNAPEVFQGVNFAAGTPVNTQLKLQWADLSYEIPITYDQFPPKESYLNALVTIKAIRGVFSMTNNSGQTGTHPPIAVPFPMGGFHGKYRVFQDTDFEFRAAGVRAGVLDILGWSYDLEAGVSQKLFGDFQVTGKYRYFTFYNRDSEDHRFGFRLYGPEVYAVYHF